MLQLLLHSLQVLLKLPLTMPVQKGCIAFRDGSRIVEEARTGKLTARLMRSMVIMFQADVKDAIRDKCYPIIHEFPDLASKSTSWSVLSVEMDEHQVKKALDDRRATCPGSDGRWHFNFDNDSHDVHVHPEGKSN